MTKLKKCTIQRYISYWLYVVLSLAIPIGLIAWRFDLFKKPGPLQITGYGIIAIIIAFFIFKGHLKRAVDDMEHTWVRTVIQNIIKLIPLVVFWAILMFMESFLDKIKFILFFTIIGYILAAFVDVWHTEMVNKCKELKEEEKETKKSRKNTSNESSQPETSTS